MKVGDRIEIPFDGSGGTPEEWTPSLFEKGFLLERVDPAGKLIVVPLKAGDVEFPALEGKDSAGRVIVRIPSKTFRVDALEGQEEVPEVLPARELGLPISAYVGLVLAIVGLFSGAWALIRWSRRPRAIRMEPVMPVKSARQVALEALAEVARRGDSEDPAVIKAQYFAVSDALKEFLGKVFDFPAPESTDEEVVLSVRSKNAGLGGELSELFSRLDLTKYANSTPLRRDLMAVLETARAMVERAG